MRRMISAVLLALVVGSAHAQSINLAVLKTSITTSVDPVVAGTANCAAYVGVAVNAVPNNSDGNGCLVEVYALAASPPFFVWRTNVSRADVYNTTPQPENSTWNWTTFKNQGATEQTAWIQMFMGDQANFAQPNVRAGVAAIFTGNAAANAQQAHVLAVGRRAASRAERIFAVGTGTTAAPALLTFEGKLSPDDVQAARNLP